jgi:glycosyltransferase involved in cell wall biosynthesis
MRSKKISIVGCVGIPNRYGGFESFAENIAPALLQQGFNVTVTCDASRYSDDLSPFYKGISRKFLKLPANGALSPLHDLVAFFSVLWRSNTILVLGVSGGVFFPLFRLLCQLLGCRLIVNIDGVEWRRSKFSGAKRRFLYICDSLAQRFAHEIIYDNAALAPYVKFPKKSHCIAYSGDHAIRLPDKDDSALALSSEPNYALTICRIEPENNCDLLISGFLNSDVSTYKFIGNWNASEYGKSLREKYKSNTRLQLLDPIYDPKSVYHLRKGCSCYLHGHTVGGTNPSLVEMLFFDCAIFCYDCSFNRETAKAGALYFSDIDSLARELSQAIAVAPANRDAVREEYSTWTIVAKLMKLIS